jgi:diacylglycerol kinase
MRKRINSFAYALRGIRLAVGSEVNIKIHLTVALLVVLCGFVFEISMTEWLVVFLCFGLVLAMEIMNTAIETVVDLVSPNQHKLAGKAKDLAAGAVLIAAIFAAICGLIIFLPKGWLLVCTIINCL